MMAATHAFTGISGTVTPSSANPTPEWQGNFRFTLAGTPGAFDFDVPSGETFSKLFMVENNTDGVATAQVVGGGGASQDVQIGESRLLYSNGTDVARAIQNGGTGFIPLNLESLREIAANDIDTLTNHGGILTSDSTPAYLRLNGATDKALHVSWLTTDVTEVQFPPTFMPPDLDSAKDLTIHLLARMVAGSVDVPTIDVQVFDAIGDTEMGGATAALSTTLAELTVTITAANISGHPLGFLNITITPGAHSTAANTVELYAAWIEYQKVIV